MKRGRKQKKVAIIGAGAAGLACARTLADSGVKVVVVEARSRIGGRVYTHRNVSLGHAIELGAEFMHGAPKATMNRANSLGLPFYDVCDTHFMRKGKSLKEVQGFWEKLEDKMKNLRTDPSRDRSFADFLKRQKLSSEDRKLLVAFVEGFHGADTELLSEVGLAQTQQTDEQDIEGSQNFRFLHGYDRLMQGFVGSVGDSRLELRLNTVAKAIHWTKRKVTIETQSLLGSILEPIDADACVVTLPIGVLKAGPDQVSSLRFIPELSILTRSIDALEMGHALRLVLKFKSRAWEGQTEKPIGFLHGGPNLDFPTWWTMNPLRLPLITAWQGGPRAFKLGQLSETEQVDRALTTLAKLLGRRRSFLEAELQSWYTHNWSQDPFSLGAYSYVKVGGAGIAKKFSRPVAGNLFFAGEATVSNSARGTVNGAIESGLRAAKQFLSS